jgi:hypothetical protein
MLKKRETPPIGKAVRRNTQGNLAKPELSFI